MAQTASQTASVFDCAVRLVGASYASRNFDYTITSTGIQGGPTHVADLFNNWNMYSSTCTANNWNIAFDNDRREWISSITVYLYAEMTTGYPTQFVVKARNNNLEEWATLKTVTA